MHCHGIRAAEGWIELGNYDEAAEELHNCPPAIKSSMPWVKLWVRVHVATKHWREVEMMCETLAKHAPEDPFTVFNRAEAFHRQHRSREAFEVFSHAPASFKKIPTYFYDYARYLCALEEFTLALSCLGKAFDLDAGLRMRALDDPDLERVWLDLQEE
jgi:tetratricopeptide (TPR) repeat protein